MKDPVEFYMDALYLVLFDIILIKLLLDQYHTTQKITHEELNFVIEVYIFTKSMHRPAFRIIIYLLPDGRGKMNVFVMA